MKQLLQQLKSGYMEIMDVPVPSLQKGHILVRNHYSVISAGTESKTVSDARKGYLAKAKSRQKEVKMVVDMARTLGVKKTYQMVMNKLEAYSSLGYSTAGEVIQVAEDVTKFKVGDLVACGGSSANHAEVISVPINLAVKVDPSIDLKHAAFTTVAAIALQGIRQAELKLGEKCVVIGLGLVGQLTIQLLNAAGVYAIGVDINEHQVALAKKAGAWLAFNRSTKGLEQSILELTNGYGADAIIITAATTSNDPVELAGIIARPKAKVVIVGAVPTGFNRENYYKKELDLRMSCSYGPGRYDPVYELKGIDYPIGYVRWTENRNMEAFVELLRYKKIDIEPLITHEFELENAPNAYDLILSKKEPYTGIVLKYNLQNQLNLHEDQLKWINKKSTHTNKGVNIGFIGAGSFAQNMLLPAISDDFNKVGVATSRGNTALSVAKKFSFQYSTTNPNKIIEDQNINTIFITTRHHLHAEYVIKGLDAQKNVFVEKPLCLTEDELLKIKESYKNSSATLMVGFNRRFSPLVIKLKDHLSAMQNMVPLSINYRINAGFVPKDHWTQDPEIGGGRIIGEVCHFIDLCLFLAGSKITSVYANIMNDANQLNDTLAIILKFENGSLATITYYANGSKKFPKEYLEVFRSGVVYTIDDFKTLTIYDDKIQKIKAAGQDKGHKNEVEIFLKNIEQGKTSPIEAEEIFLTTLATFKVIESIKHKKVIYL